MKGMELCERFFAAEGVPALVRSNREVLPYLAAGLVGEGSECFGTDDEFSRDHDWGAGFCIWLPHDVFTAFSDSVADSLRSLPGYAGFESKFSAMRGMNDGRIGVFSVAGFYRKFIGFDHVPESLEQWWAIPEANLAVATNGKVFCDRYGEFSRWRSRLTNGCPKDIRLKRMAYCCYLALQAGQYNYGRMVRRGMFGAAAVAEAAFVGAALRLVYYLNRAYPPFYKWIQPLVRALPVLGEESYSYSESLASASPVTTFRNDGKGEIIDCWCAEIAQALYDCGLISDPYASLYQAAVDLHDSIEEGWLRDIPLEVPC